MDIPTPGDENLFAHLALEKGLITSEQLRECMQIQVDLAANGTKVPGLREILVRRGYLSDAAPTAVTIAAEDKANHMGRYVRVSRLGEGGMGEVWKGWDLELGRWVALKILKGTDPEELARFKREALTAAQLGDAGIAAVYEIGDAGGRPFIAMQFVDGRTLDRAHKSDPREIAEFVRQAAVAIHHAHERGIIHRDIKPANLAEAAGRVTVLDFGLAKGLRVGADISTSGTIIGTPSFMSPEQAWGAPDLDRRTDVYSLGATLYDLLVGRPPFRAEDVLTLLRQITEDEPRPLRAFRRGIDAELETIVMKCLEKDRERRYATALELADDLQRWLNGDPIHAHPASILYRFRKRIRKRQAVLVCALIGAMAVLVTVAVLTPRVLRERARKERESRIRELQAQVAGYRMEADSYARTGDLARAKRKYREAEELCRKSIDQSPIVRCTLARILIDQGKLEEAERQLDLAIDEPGARFLRGFVRLRRWDDSNDDLVVAEGSLRTRQPKAPPPGLLDDLRHDPGSRIDGWFANAELARLSGRNDEAESGLRRVIAEEPAYVSAHLSLALLMLNQGRNEAALDALNQAIERHRGLPRAHLYRGLLFLSKRGEDWYRRALEDFERYVDLHEGAPFARNMRGVARYLLGDFRGAEEDFDARLSETPTDLNALVNRGKARTSLGNLRAAIADFGAALSLDSRHAEAYFARGIARFAGRDFAGAIEDYTRALEFHPDDATIYYDRGDAYRLLGKLDEAERDYTKAIALDPRLAQAFDNRAIVHMARGNRQKALEDWTRAIEVNPRLANPYANRGKMRLASGERESAIEDFTRCIELEPSHSEAWTLRGRARLERGQIEAALRDLNEAIRLKSDRVDARHLRSKIRAQLRDLDGAIEDLTVILNASPNEVQPRIDRAALRCEKGDFQGSVEDYDVVLRLRPDTGELYYNRGRSKLILGDNAGAIDDCTKAITRVPTLDVAYTCRAIARANGGDFAGAIADYTRAIELNPKDGLTFRQRGAAYAKLERHDEAIADFGRAIELDPRDALSYASRGSSRRAKGDREGAVADFGKALDVAPPGWSLRHEVQRLLEEAKR